MCHGRAFGWRTYSGRIGRSINRTIPCLLVLRVQCGISWTVALPLWEVTCSVVRVAGVKSLSTTPAGTGIAPPVRLCVNRSGWKYGGRKYCLYRTSMWSSLCRTR
jgi:hypothetical protein